MTAELGAVWSCWSTLFRSRIWRSSSFRSSTFCRRRRESASAPGDAANSVVDSGWAVVVEEATGEEGSTGGDFLGLLGAFCLPNPLFFLAS